MTSSAYSCHSMVARSHSVYDCSKFLAVFVVVVHYFAIRIDGAPDIGCTDTLCTANWTSDAYLRGDASSLQFQLYGTVSSSDTSGSTQGALLCLTTATTCSFSLPLCSPRIFIYTIASSPGSAAVVLANSGGISHQVVQQSQTFDYSRNIGASFRYFYGNQRTSTTVELFWANLGTNATSLAIWASQFSVSARLESERYLSDSASVLATLSPSVSSDLHVLQFDKVLSLLQPSTSYDIRVQGTFCTNQTTYSPWIRLRTSSQADFVQSSSTATPSLSPPVFIDAGFRMVGPNAEFYAEPLTVTTDLITNIFRSALAPHNDNVRVLCFGASATNGSVIVLQVQVASANALLVQAQLAAFPTSSLLLTFATNLFSQRGYLGSSSVTLQLERNSSIAITGGTVACPVGTSEPIATAATSNAISSTALVATSPINASVSPTPTVAARASNDSGLLKDSTFILTIGIIGGLTVLICMACVGWHLCCRPPMDHVDSSQTLTNNFSMSHVQHALYEASVF